MKWFFDLATRTKLFLGFGVAIVLLAAVILAAADNVSLMEKTQDEIFEHEFANSVDVLTMKSHIDSIRLALLTMMGAERSAMDSWHSAIKDRNSEIEALFKRLYARNTHEPAITEELRGLEKVYSEFRSTRDRQLIPHIYAGRDEAARALAQGVQSERYERMAEIVRGLEEKAAATAREHIEFSRAASKRYMNFFIALGAAAIVLSALVALFLNRIIARPLKEISEAAARIAAGDLSVAISDPGRDDEVGALCKTFKGMMERLQKQTRDIAEAVSVLASSSNEIAATTSQLASGAEQTAVAVSETTTTVEEVKQTANVSSQKARHVSEIAQNAAQVSQNGSRLVKDTLAGVNHIREQMEYIAGTIVRLAEHNQAIAEIIAAVDDLSEQSNLLAVNASIEASKAGEHGKGFIIVAQEIKSLSEQSKQATRQVRAILNDIQKSSGAAVMATERGTKAVEATVLQSSGTGESIQALAGSIGEASQAVIQIAASSQQQLVGMDQVAIAMNSIKQATTQTAASTKQVELTIRNLQELGVRLKALVQHYRL